MNMETAQSHNAPLTGQAEPVPSSERARRAFEWIAASKELDRYLSKSEEPQTMGEALMRIAHLEAENKRLAESLELKEKENCSLRLSGDLKDQHNAILRRRNGELESRLK